MTSGSRCTADAVRWTPNPGFSRAALGFADGSRLIFEHSSRRSQRRRRRLLERIAEFRLNDRRLQLFFPDGTNLEFLPVTTDRAAFALEEYDGTAMGEA
jgi:hypothetical protein